MIKKLVAIVLLALLLWGVYIAYAILSSPPEFTARWGNVDENTTEIILSGKWKTYRYIPISIEKISFKFMDEKVGSTENITSEKNNTTVKIRIKNRNVIEALFKYLDNNQKGTFEIEITERILSSIQTTFKIKKEIHMNIFRKLNFTAESKPILGGLAYTPALLSTKVRWGGEKGNKGILIADMEFYNPNSFPIPVANLTFDLYANGIKIGSGYLPETKIIPPKGDTVIKAVILLNKGNITLVWTTHVKNYETSDITAKIKLSTQFLGKKFEIPLLPVKTTIKTNILEHINDALSQLTRG